MKKSRLFVFAYILCFTLTMLSCVYAKQPLVLRAEYSLIEILKFAALIAFLTGSLVYLNLPFLKWLKNRLRIHSDPLPYYVVATLIVLQVVTLAVGYLESWLRYTPGADFLYYYKGVTNSLIYIGTGNITALFIAFFYGQSEQTKSQTHSEIIDANEIL